MTHIINPYRYAGFTDPSDVSGLELWLDGSGTTYLYTDAGSTNVTSDGDAVYQWNDRSGNDRHVIQSTSGYRPLYKTNRQNSLSAVLFDGSDDYLQGAFGSSLSQPNTIFIVCKWASTTPLNATDGDDASNRHVIQTQTTLPELVVRLYAGAGYDTDPDSVVASTWYYMTCVFKTTSSYVRKNGSSIGTPGDAGTQAMDGITVGARYDGTRPWDSDIGEILVYSSEITGTDLTNIESYLSTKWNL